MKLEFSGERIATTRIFIVLDLVNCFMIINSSITSKMLKLNIKMSNITIKMLDLLGLH